MLKQRVISAAIMLLIFVLVNFFVGEFVFALAMCLLAAFAGWEWSRLNGVVEPKHQILFGALAALVSMGLVLLVSSPTIGQNLIKLFSLSVGVFWISVAVLFYRLPIKSSAGTKPDYVSLLTGLYLLGACVCFSHLLHAESLGGSAFLFIYAMCTVWAMDIGAYFAGKKLGKHKLAPKISPGKTWEGVVGGLLCAFVLACIVLSVADFASDRKLALILATVFAAGASILGDLYESRMKRAAGLKDSSQLIPGHGGLLDRVDGVIASVPVFAFSWIWV